MSSTIVHVVQRMAPGGIETLVLDLALADPRIHIISLEGTSESLLAAWPRLQLIGGRLIGLGKPDAIVPRLVTQIAGLLRKLHASAVVAHHIGPLVYAGLAARLTFVPVRVHVEHDGWHYQDKHRRRIGRWLDRVVKPRKVAVSRVTADSVTSALGIKQIEIIPNGADLAKFRPRAKAQIRQRLGLPQGAPLIGTVGRLTAVKGHDLLIRAMLFTQPDTHLVIVGDGEERGALETWIEMLNLGDRVHFLDQQDQLELIYPAFDVFCLPSRAEGFPRVLIEAQACGVPVVAARVGGTPEAVCPKTGKLVEPESPEALGLALAGMLEDLPSDNPRNFVDPRFSLKSTVDAYSKVTAS